jgi:hypothetical protein
LGVRPLLLGKGKWKEKGRSKNNSTTGVIIKRIKRYNSKKLKPTDMSTREETNFKQYAITISNGYDQDWEYFDTKEDADIAFEESKRSGDVHYYEYNKELGYEVIDSFWVGDYECPMCESEDVQHQGKTMVCIDCNHKEETQYFQK